MNCRFDTLAYHSVDVKNELEGVLETSCDFAQGHTAQPASVASYSSSLQTTGTAKILEDNEWLICRQLEMIVEILPHSNRRPPHAFGD